MLNEVLPNLNDTMLSRLLANKESLKRTQISLPFTYYPYPSLIINSNIQIFEIGRPKGSLNMVKGKRHKLQGKPRKVQGIKFGQYHLDLEKHAHHVYAMHLGCDAGTRFGIGSGFISMSRKPSDDVIYHICARVNVDNYELITIFR